MTTWGASPLMVDPFWLTWEETTTDMKDGTEAGGPELLPGCVVHAVAAVSPPGLSW